MLISGRIWMPVAKNTDSHSRIKSWPTFTFIIGIPLLTGKREKTPGMQTMVDVTLEQYGTMVVRRWFPWTEKEAPTVDQMREIALKECDGLITYRGYVITRLAYITVWTHSESYET